MRWMRTTTRNMGRRTMTEVYAVFWSCMEGDNTGILVSIHRTLEGARRKVESMIPYTSIVKKELEE